MTGTGESERRVTGTGESGRRVTGTGESERGAIDTGKSERWGGRQGESQSERWTQESQRGGDRHRRVREGAVGTGESERER